MLCVAFDHARDVFLLHDVEKSLENRAIIAAWFRGNRLPVSFMQHGYDSQWTQRMRRFSSCRVLVLSGFRLTLLGSDRRERAEPGVGRACERPPRAARECRHGAEPQGESPYRRRRARAAEARRRAARSRSATAAMLAVDDLVAETGCSRRLGECVARCRARRIPVYDRSSRQDRRPATCA